MRMKVKFAKHSVLVRKKASWRQAACADIYMRQYKVRSAQCKGKQEPVSNRLQWRFHKDSPGPVCPMVWTGRRP
jgi:hypothetical protein